MLTSMTGVLFGVAAAQTASATAGLSAPPRVDYKVVVWYRQDRPLETFKYQTYDVRKGEYTPAVDAWLELMRTKHPAYVVMVRDVDLGREKGETESLKVGSVVMRELTAAASLEGIVVGAGLGGRPFRPLVSRPGFSPPPGMAARPYPPGTGPPRSVDLNPPAYSFPFPMPYPRPRL
jgi:hypothetical protein